MTWIDILVSWYLGSQLVIGSTLLCTGLPRRKYMLLKWLGFTIVILLISTFFVKTWVWNDQLLVMSGMLKTYPARILIMILAFLQIWACYKIYIWDALYIFVFVLTFQRLEFSIYKIVEASIHLNFPGSVSLDAYLLLINYILYILFLIYIRHIYLKKFKEVRIHGQSHFALILVLIIYTFNDFGDFYIWSNDPFSNVGATMIAMRLKGILFYLVTFYMLYNHLGRQELEVENATLEAISRQRMNQYSFSQDLINNINIKSHDLKKQIRYLKDYGNERNDLLEELENSVESYDSLVQTRNETLSIVLTEKSIICQRENIPFSCIADGEGLEFMKELDIYTLFTNLMDNAIEASKTLTDGNCSINLIVKKKDSFISIHEENYYSGDVVFREGIPVTTKKDIDYHGFGVKSMYQIIEKYDGIINIKTSHNKFQVNILIPIPEGYVNQ